MTQENGPRDDTTDIVEFYERSVEAESARLDRNQVEFRMTMRYLDEYLPPKSTVLDVGCASGRYAVALARAGHRVTAVDVAPALLARCESAVRDARLTDRVTTHLADARDLSSVPGDGFDAALLLGPLYHLVEREDRLVAVREAARRLRAGGFLFSAHISRFGMVKSMAARHPVWVERRANVDAILTDGHLGELDPRKGGFRGYYATAEELAPLHEAAGLQTVAVAALDYGGMAINPAFASLPREQQDGWIELFYRINREPSVVGSSPHLLYVARRAGSR